VRIGGTRPVRRQAKLVGPGTGCCEPVMRSLQLAAESNRNLHSEK